MSEPAQPDRGRAAFALAGLSALGIVFGDIGTSPLYTLKTVFAFLGGEATPDRILGVLSLVVWTLFIVTSVKYVIVAMSIDNDGEGGILALMSLLGVQRQRRPAIVLAGLLGAALIYGDGAITPAISVLSALEGFEIAAPGLTAYVVPAAVAILLALFAHRGGVRTDHGGLVHCDRRARCLGRRPRPRGACRPQSLLRLSALGR
jgi:KUP system potassium uptake protein